MYLVDKLKWKNADMRKCAGLKSVVYILISVAFVHAGHGLSNEIYLARQWRDLETSHSALVNPSFAAYHDWITVSSAFSITQLNRFFLTNIEAIVPLTTFASKSQTVGVGYVGYNSGEFDRTSWKLGRIIKQEDANQYSEHYGTISYALRPIPILAVGANVNIGYQSNFDNPVIDASFDLGASLKLKSLFLGNYILGLSLLNPARVSRFEIPLYNPDVGLSFFFEREIKKIVIDGGLELNYRSFWGENYGSKRFDVSGRLGTRLNDFLHLYLQAGNQYAGFSVKFNTFTNKLPKIMNNASAAMQVLFTREQFRPSNTVYFVGQFGNNRNFIAGDAYDLYQKAQTRMSEKKYWDAYAYFSLLEKEYPDFSKNDEVRLRSAICLEKLYMYDKSIEKYNQTKKLYIDDNYEDERKIVGGADLGLLRIFRQHADSQKVLDQFNLLKKSQAYDSLKEHGWYELGQFYMDKEDWFSAIDALNNIQFEHPDYPFAQYSIAICKTALEKPLRDLIPIFNEVLSFDAKTPEQWEINYKANYALGCIYYEMNKYKEAQGYLAEIPASSAIYYDALVVLGWARFKSRLWNDCRKVAEVMQNCNIPDVQAEGYILEGYALLNDSTMIQNRSKTLPRSVQQIEKANEVLPTLNYFLNLDKAEIDVKIDSIVKEVSSLINKYHNDLDSNSERQFIIKSMDNLRGQIENRCNEITNQYYQIDMTRHYKSNEERIRAIINDVEYLSAKYKLLLERELGKSEDFSVPPEMQQE